MSEDASGAELVQKMATRLFEELDLEQVQDIYGVCSLAEFEDCSGLCGMGDIVGRTR